LGGRELGRATPSLLSHHPLRLSPDDTLVYAGGELFHTLDLTPVGMLSSMLPAGGNAAGASFTEDGTRLLLAWNNSVYEFTVDGRSLADRACALAGRNLTAAERALSASPASPACAQWPSEP